MAEEATPKPAEADHLDPYERKYFATRGESEIPVTPTEAPAVPTEKPAVEGGEAKASPPSPQADAGKPADKEPPEDRKVDIGSLHEERKRRQDAEEKARQMELLNARMEERFRTFRDAMTPRQQQQPQAPSPDQDIFGAVRHLQQDHARTRQEIENYKRQIQQEDYLRQLNQWAADSATAFARQNPDYLDAYKHMRGARARQLQVWGMSPSAIGTQLQHEENQLLARAAAERRNPAQMVYDLAHQMGYQKAAAPTAPAQNSGASRHEVNMNLERIEAGQKQSGSLSTVGGGGGGRDVGDIEIEDLLKMSDKEFGNFIEKHPQRFRRLKGAAH